MIDYKTKCEQVSRDYLQLKRQYDRLQRDNDQLRQVCAILLDGHPAIVLRNEELERAPKIEVYENISGEAVIRVRR